MTRTPTKIEMTYLKMYNEKVRSISIAPVDAEPMIEAGWLEWMPPVWGGYPDYAITEAGAALVSAEFEKETNV